MTFGALRCRRADWSDLKLTLEEDSRGHRWIFTPTHCMSPDIPDICGLSPRAPQMPGSNTHADPDLRPHPPIQPRHRREGDRDVASLGLLLPSTLSGQLESSFKKPGQTLTPIHTRDLCWGHRSPPYTPRALPAPSAHSRSCWEGLAEGELARGFISLDYVPAGGL